MSLIAQLNQRIREINVAIKKTKIEINELKSELERVEIIDLLTDWGEQFEYVYEREGEHTTFTSKRQAKAYIEDKIEYAENCVSDYTLDIADKEAYLREIDYIDNGNNF